MKKQVDFMKKKTIDAFNDASIKVPFIIPEITKSDKNAVLNALSSRLLTDGPKLHKYPHDSGWPVTLVLPLNHNI